MIQTVLFETIKGFFFLLLHFGILAGTVILIEKKFGLHSEVYRKLLHIVSVFSIMPIVIPATNWISSFIICLLFIGLAYLGATRTNLEKDVNMTQRKQGEQTKSMILLYSTYAVLILVAWGIFGQKWGTVLSVIAWGIGDALHPMALGLPLASGTVLMSVSYMVINNLLLAVNANAQGTFGISRSIMLLSTTTQMGIFMVCSPQFPTITARAIWKR